MKPKISFVTLGVSDVARAVAFYRDGLGFPTHNYTDGDAFVLLRLEGSWLGLISRKDLAEELKAPVADGQPPSISLSHNVGSPDLVREVFAQAIAAGARPVKEPQKVYWGGFSGYFADPDGYCWEVAHNPFTDLT